MNTATKIQINKTTKTIRTTRIQTRVTATTAIQEIANNVIL